VSTLRGKIKPDTFEWGLVRKYINARIELLRSQLEADIGPTETARLRGAVAELRQMIAEVEPSAPLDPAMHEDEPPLY
jgi:hypothetical protein